MNENQQVPMVPSATVDIVTAQFARIIRWLIVAIVIISLAFAAYVVVQYLVPNEIVETQEIEATQQGDGTYLLGGGDVNYGKAGSTNPQD